MFSPKFSGEAFYGINLRYFFSLLLRLLASYTGIKSVPFLSSDWLVHIQALIGSPQYGLDRFSRLFLIRLMAGDARADWLIEKSWSLIFVVQQFLENCWKPFNAIPLLQSHESLISCDTNFRLFRISFPWWILSWKVYAYFQNAQLHQSDQ